ncbi:MAG: glycosyltransferase family 4 protein [Candidatus Sumerlaeia bacterium]|nr:glycosyltransferase family 4 protein [Candidatus Sumerlaeia bacterium]
MPSMNIGLVIDYYWPHAISGAERSTRELARALAARSHAVTVLTPNYGAAPEEDDAGVAIRRYWFPQRLEPGRMAPAFWAKNLLYYRISARAIASIARRRGVEILHAQNTYVQIPTYLAAHRLGIPCVATVRDLNSLCPIGHLLSAAHDPQHQCAKDYRRCAREFLACYHPDASWIFRWQLRLDALWKRLDLALRQRALRRFSKIIFVSRGLMDEYVRHGFAAQPGQLAVVHNLPPHISEAELDAAPPQPPAEWNLPDRAPVIAYVGKLSLGKGAHILLDAIPRVLARHPDAVFVFAGRPTAPVKIPPAIPPSNLRLLGHVPAAAVHALLRRAALFILPSIWPEPLSSAVLEAQAFGVPVIGTARGGTPEQIIEGENGWLVEPANAAALAGAIAAALDDPVRLARMRPRCRALVRERFDEERIIRQTVDIYRESALSRG